MPETFPSSVPYAAYLAYSPRGTSDVSQRSQRLIPSVKFGRVPGAMDAAAERILAHVHDGGFDGVFGDDVTLVPMPGHAPRVPESYWPAERISDALRRAELANTVLPALRRLTPVRKSATAAPGERPTVRDHIDSMLVDLEEAWGLLAPRRIVLVDDFITKGATLYAGAALLMRAIPEAQLSAFALVRTMGLVPEIERIVDPVQGVIRYSPASDSVDRQP